MYRTRIESKVHTLWRKAGRTFGVAVSGQNTRRPERADKRSGSTGIPSVLGGT